VLKSQIPKKPERRSLTSAGASLNLSTVMMRRKFPYFGAHLGTVEVGAEVGGEVEVGV